MLKQELILIISQNQRDIESLEEILKENSYRLSKTNNTAEAFELLEKESPDLIILDISLATENFLTTQTTPIILLGTLEKLRDRLAEFELGEVDYLVKPFFKEQVLTRVNIQSRLAGDDSCLDRLKESEQKHRRISKEVILGVLQDITAKKELEQRLQAKNQQLEERVKELNCLYSLTQIIEERDYSLEETMEEVANTIADFWKHPEIARVRIKLAGQEFKSQDFRTSNWQQSSEIIVRDESLGKVEIYYLEERVEEYEGPFLKEERALLDTIAKRLSKLVERKLVENELEAERNYLQQVIDLLPNFVFAKDWEGRFILVNQALTQLCGVNKEEILGKKDAIFTEEQVAAKLMESDRQIIEEEAAEVNLEEKIVDSQGESRWFQITKVPLILSADKQDRQILGVATDITELKKTEEQLIEAREKAMQANQAKSEFLANMSHEIRTPLNAVLGFSEILENEFKGSKLAKEEHISYLNSIKQAGNSLLSLINDILDMSKIEAGMMEINPVYFNPQALCQEMQVIFHKQLLDKGLELIIEAEDDLLEVKLDEVKLRQILINLLGNAIKFTKKGSIKLIVKSELNSDTERLDLKVQVQDTGIGISEENQERVFESFTQQDSKSNREYEGTGLGLAITRKLTRLMDGEIYLDSKEGVGSCFTLKFFDLEFRRAEPKYKEQEKQNFSFKQAQVLIAEDVKSNRELLKIKLKNRGLDVLEAWNGQEAVQLAIKHEPDLIIMDLKMPIMNGYQAHREIRKNEKVRLPIIALTASATDYECSKVAESDFDEFLTKPIKDDRLNRLLAKHLPCVKEEEAASDPITKSDYQGSLAAEVIEQLKAKFESRLEELEGAIVINEVEDFAEELEEFVKQHQLEELLDYTVRLNRYASDFDIDGLKDALAEFRALLED
ncbi:response regulator [Fuchsiella alkaliacetigena]|uniref:response regulator n=1 Tax=Fuchsiella alkaliacetigena TaxID=957042 RepID=UPI00200B6C51|nr:response regulator [Fuchsiella alkaliacetigena]MCK8825737.1 response regulator [Fuchsiella alkaliacetigena]